MTLHPIKKSLFSWQSHVSALQYLSLLYRRPAQFHNLIKGMPHTKAVIIGLFIYLQVLPYIMFISIFGCLLVRIVSEILVAEQPAASLTLSSLCIGILSGNFMGIIIAIAALFIFGIYHGIDFGIKLGISVWLTVGLSFGISMGIASGIADDTELGIARNIMFGIAIGISFGITLGVVHGIIFGIAPSLVLGLVAGTTAGLVLGMIAGTAVGITAGITTIISVTRAYYYVPHLAFTWPVAKGLSYPLHPVAWDYMCSLPFPRLSELLVPYAEFVPQVGRQEIDRLISSYPSQRMAALRALAVLIARGAADEHELSRLDGIMAQLPEGETGFLTETRRLREMVGEICHLQRRLDTVDRPIFRERDAALLTKEIENFHYRIGGFHEPLASEFRVAAERWLEVAERHRREARVVAAKEPTPQLFRAGDPVDRRQEAFVPRQSIIGELERQVVLPTSCSGLLVYGRRRMGKSTLLKNLAGFLPDSVRVLSVSMEDPRTFNSLPSFLQFTMERIQEPLLRAGYVSPASPAASADLSAFFNFLSACNDGLERSGERLILAFDEYRYIDEKIGAGVFSADLLATIRESIQSHRRLTWAFVGSHAIDDLPHAPWPSYLVSVRTVELPPFSEAETRLLLTEPLRHSPVWERDDPRRPRFDAVFWGEGGIERIHAEAAGWPHLVQLIAETAVDLLNDTDARRLDATLLERALDRAIVRGDVVLRQLMERECALPGEWDYLCSFRTRDTQPPPDDEAVHRSLRRRLLVADEAGAWRLRVPLMQRWLRERG